jgi:hypothetical protein
MNLEAYGHAHSDRTNLALHLALVPAFQAGLALAVFGAATSRLHTLACGLLVSAVSMALQGVGHRRERIRPQFANAFDFVRRIFLEQLFTFPRFVLTGAFARTWRRAAASERTHG